MLGVRQGHAVSVVVQTLPKDRRETPMTDDWLSRIKAEHEQLVAANCRYAANELLQDHLHKATLENLAQALREKEKLAAENARWQLTVSTVKSLTQDLERERARLDEALQVNAKLERDLKRQAITSRVVWESNTWMHARLEKVDELADLWSDPPEEGFRREVTAKECGLTLLEELHGLQPAPTLPEVVRATFYFRDRKSFDGGTVEAACGDGCGFVTACDDKLALEFDCAGVLACADLTYDYLRTVLAEEGLTIAPADFDEDRRRADYYQGAAANVRGQRDHLEQGIRNYVEWCQDQIRDGFTTEPLEEMIRELTGLLESSKQGRAKNDNMQIRPVQGDSASEPKPD
jgi:hypothetical protein